MSAKREAERYFKRRNEYWMFEKNRKKPVAKSPLREMKDAAAAECRRLGIHGTKDYSCKALVRIILDEELATEDDAINLLCGWYVGKIESEAENAERKAKSAKRTKGERDRAAKPEKQCNSIGKKQKRRSWHILRARTVPDGDSYKVIDIVYR